MSEDKTDTWICPQCGTENPKSAKTCQRCGLDFEESPVLRKTRDPWPAVLFWALMFLLALILLHFVRPYMDWNQASTRSPLSRAKVEMRSLSIAIDAYMVDANQYVAATRGDEGINAFLPKGDPGREIFTFRRRQADRPDGQIMTLTTPTAFITSYPADPYARTRGTIYGYYNDSDKGYILFSAGPDGDYDIDPVKDYDALTTSPLPQLLMKTYDPTNGSKSDGDIWRIKQ